MGFRFRRSVKLFPGVRVNLSRGGASLSLGGPGATINLSPRGSRATFGMPGTGLSYSAPLFRPQTDPGSRRAGSSVPIRSTQQLVDAVANPRSTVVYQGSGRRLSAQQLTAQYRKLAEGEARGRAQAEVSRIEAELVQLLNLWRDLAYMPGADECRAALNVRPFANDEEPPAPPDLMAEEFTLRARVLEDVDAAHHDSFLRRAAPIFAALVLGALMGAEVFIAAQSAVIAGGVGAIAAVCAAVGASALTRARRTREIARLAAAAGDAAWVERRALLETTFADSTAAHRAREEQSAAAWAVSEGIRVAWATRLVTGDEAAIDEAVSASLGDLDFPFDTECAVGIVDASAAFIDFDLPEIEDVIPDVRHTVLKDGSLKETKRKAAERNADYAGLVTGLALTVASAAFASAPTLHSVTIGAYTQRKTRGSDAVEDTYVYETRIARSFVAGVDAANVNPMEALAAQETRIDWGANSVLKKIAPPAWTKELRP